MNEEKNWYAVYTRPRWEKKVAVLLQEQGFAHYCPLNKVHKQWSDRRAVVVEPLFKGYVFVQVAEAHKWSVKKVDGILNFVHWLGKPAIVKEEEIDIIRKFLHEFDDVQVTGLDIKVADNVVIKQGVLMDYQGMVLEVHGNTAKVRIESMGLSLSAVFQKANLEKL